MSNTTQSAMKTQTVAEIIKQSPKSPIGISLAKHLARGSVGETYEVILGTGIPVTKSQNAFVNKAKKEFSRVAVVTGFASYCPGKKYKIAVVNMNRTSEYHSGQHRRHEWEANECPKETYFL